VSLHDWLFNLPVDETTRRRRSPFSSTLVLPGLNIYEGLKIDDPEKANWRDYVFRARGRDLKGAILDLASLPRVDFTGAQLQGALLFRATLQRASLADAQLQGASLDVAKLQGARLDYAQLQGARLDYAQLQGASLFQAQLQSASLDGAQLQGASFDGAQLQGASLQQASLRATDLSKALLWRTNRAPPTWRRDVAELASVRLSDADDQWRPRWREVYGKVHSWDDRAYQDLCQMMGVPRDEPPENVRRLDCASSDKTLSSCDASAAVPPEAAAWRTAVKVASVDDPTYAKALSEVLKTLVCSGGGDAVHVLHGIEEKSPYNFPLSRLAAAGPEAPALVDFIMSKDCPVSASLTDADRAKLLQIKQQIDKARK
jgi:uncharacterized protein YjbI with pentapeptide repeats